MEVSNKSHTVWTNFAFHVLYTNELIASSLFLFAELSYKTCWPDGHWAGKVPGDYSRPQGWTNYTVCYTPDSQKIYYTLFNSTDSNVSHHYFPIMKIIKSIYIMLINMMPFRS